MQKTAVQINITQLSQWQHSYWAENENGKKIIIDLENTYLWHTTKFRLYIRNIKLKWNKNKLGSQKKFETFLKIETEKQDEFIFE